MVKSNKRLFRLILNTEFCITFFQAVAQIFYIAPVIHKRSSLKLEVYSRIELGNLWGRGA